MPVWPLYLQLLHNFDLSKAGITVQNIMVSLAQTQQWHYYWQFLLETSRKPSCKMVADFNSLE